MTYAVSPAGLALIQEGEGFRAEPTRLPDGNWVVGYGHVRVGEPGAEVSKEEAEQLLTQDLEPVERLVNAHVTALLTQSQFDALVSFALSVGAEAFVKSQVLRRVNNAEHIAAACAMDAWRKSDASGELEVVDALVRRRAAEKAVYLREVGGETQPSAFLRAKLDYAASILGAPVVASAPRIENAPVPQAKPEPTARLAEILKSEPATEALLLTQVVTDEALDVEEIVTAHAKPAARKIEVETIELERDRRISRMRAGDVKETLWDRLTDRFDFSQSLETFGLIALILFGVGLVAVAGSLVIGGVEDWMQVAGAGALALPGVGAIAMGGFSLARGGPARA